MDKISLLYFNSCAELGLNPIPVPAMHGFEVFLGKNKYYFRFGHTPFNDTAGGSIACNKFCTNKMLLRAGLPVPNALAVTKKEYETGELNINQIKYPVVVKPTWDTGCGRDVFCNIKTPEMLKLILEQLFPFYPCLSVEEFLPDLRSYRVTIFYGKILGIVERIPAHVMGDNQHSISELITIENIKRAALKEKLPLGPLKIHTETKIIFDEMAITEDYVPCENEKIPIRYICNSTHGGTIVGLNKKSICNENAQLACQAAKALNLNFVGLDFICENISIPYFQSRGYFIEANHNPDISIHENPVKGFKEQISKIMMKKLIRQNRFHYWKERIIS